jgi:hypothetical protein
MSCEELDEREETLRYAARLRGLSLIRTGDKFALATFALNGATLDEIAAFLSADDRPHSENRRQGEDRRADLRALLKAEHAIVADLAEQSRKAIAPDANHHAVESVLAEIRRRLLDIDELRRAAKETTNMTWRDVKHSLDP